MINSTLDNILNDMHPLSFSTGKVENEVFHLGQMLKQDDHALFKDAMEAEIARYNQKNHWRIVRRTEVGHQKIIKAI